MEDSLEELISIITPSKEQIDNTLINIALSPIGDSYATYIPHLAKNTYCLNPVLSLAVQSRNVEVVRELINPSNINIHTQYMYDALNNPITQALSSLNSPSEKEKYLIKLLLHCLCDNWMFGLTYWINLSVIYNFIFIRKKYEKYTRAHLYTGYFAMVPRDILNTLLLYG